MNSLEQQLVNIKCDDIELFSLNGLKTIGKIVDIYDGDTCKIVIIHENILKKFTCRLLGIDTPEMKPSLEKTNREKEIIDAHRCRNRLLQLLTNCKNIDLNTLYKKIEIKNKINENTKIVQVQCFEFDKYGRLLVNLYADNVEKNVNQQIIDENFAKAYDGGKKEEFSYGV